MCLCSWLGLVGTKAVIRRSWDGCGNEVFSNVRLWECWSSVVLI